MALYAPLVVTTAGKVTRLQAGDQLALVPTAVPYASTITLDAAVGRMFELAVLTGDVSLLFANLVAGCTGTVWVKQDGTGGWRVGFATPAGWVVNQDVSGDLAATLSANAITRYMYAAVAVDGVGYLDIDRSTRVQTLDLVVSGTSQVVNGTDRVLAA